MSAFEVLTMGRVGVDLYPLQVGVGLDQVATFGKWLGGSATNVAVAAARYRRRAAVITRTGDDPFGVFIHAALKSYGVDDRYVTTVEKLPTPVTFCEIFPPDDFPLYFYRRPKAPDLEIFSEELDFDAIREAGVFWVTGTGLSEEPSRSATLAALEARNGRGITVLDLDYRPMFWPSREEARYWAQQALPHVSVAVGNLDEVDMAVAQREPLAAAQALHEFGVGLAVVKQGPRGVLAHDRARSVEVPPVPVDVVNGLGAGDAFGGALCHGLLAGWDSERVMRFANAAGAIVASRLACSDAMPTAEEVTRLLANGTRETPVRDQVKAILDVRARRPEAIGEAAARRKGRASLLGEDGRLLIIAADHPARGALRAGSRPTAMADRLSLLERVSVALSRPGVDGVLGTADIIEDLLLLGALDGKVVIGSMNRGGLAGSSFEMDDRFTGYDAAAIARTGLDGGKMLFRIDAADPATVVTMESCARAVSDLAAHGLMAMVEPFISHRVDGQVRNDLSPDAVIRSITVASGLGTTSAYTWLKLPVVEDMERVLAACTLPVLLLGGEVSADQGAAFEAWRKALLIPSVHGLVIGRSLLYPPDDDVAGAVDTLVGMVRG